MEILHSEFFNWTIIDYILGLAIALLISLLFHVLFEFKNKYIRMIIPTLVFIVGCFLVANQNHTEEVRIVKVNDWNEYYEFNKEENWNVIEENGNILKLSRYTD